jgi:hypothetical protein
MRRAVIAATMALCGCGGSVEREGGSASTRTIAAPADGRTQARRAVIERIRAAQAGRTAMPARAALENAGRPQDHRGHPDPRAAGAFLAGERQRSGDMRERLRELNARPRETAASPHKTGS